MRVTVEGWWRNARRWVVLFAAVLAGPVGATDVLLVSSYDQNDACGRPQYEAALEALKQGGFAGLSSQSYYLDQRTASREQLQQTVEQIKREIRATRPKLVFAFDDPAFAMLYEEVLQQPGTRMVFSGVNRRLEDYNERAVFLEGRKPVANITGVHEYLFMRDQLSLLEAVLKRPVSKVAVLHSTDAVGIILKDQILAELKNTPYADRVVALAAGDVPAMLAQARTINADKAIDAYIPVTMSVADPADGKRKTMAELAPMLIRDIRKIDLALNASFTEYGFFGGVSIDFYQMGFQSGFLASKLLKGGGVKGSPVEDARRSLVAVNRKRMQQLGIQLSPEARSIVDKWVD
jgi:ABC-type uncharacterized transport system substrate-binding protein